MSRMETEASLDFIGFIIFENKLKPTTAAVLKELTDANIKSVMVTGDNILTAISVARECGLLDQNAHCFVPRFIRGKDSAMRVLDIHTDESFSGDFRDPNAEIQWDSIDNQLYRLDHNSLQVSTDLIDGSICKCPLLIYLVALTRSS